jgi:peptide/nickel transport system ATP-binding protein
MSLLQIRNLSLCINRLKILHDISMDISPGEIVAITGESGSGKSMAALATMQLLPEGSKTKGQILINDRDTMLLSETEMCRLRGNTVGMVFQEPMTALNPVQTIGAQVAESVRLHRPDLDPMARAAEVLTRVGLSPELVSLSRFPHTLSGGQRQRVIIAIAIACSPKLLIADEPTTALDVTTQAQILHLLQKLTTEDSLGLMMITHDLAVVTQMADQIIIMKHPYTKALIAASAHRAILPRLRQEAPLLRVRNVVQSYALPRRSIFMAPEDVYAVNDVSFDIPKGIRLGLVGESGCGKSTLTRSILGLEPVKSGTITLDGEHVFSAGRPNLAVRRRMQVVFQDPYGSFNPRHRVARLITEPFNLLDKKPTATESMDRIAKSLTSVGLLPSDAQKYPHQFSGGQRQRIAIARAIIIRPDLIIFDEAVSALDVSVRAQILDLITELCRQYNLTYLFISHDLSVVRNITDHVLVMKSGKIVERGSTEEVFSNPQDTYTKSLISAAPQLSKRTYHA